MLLVAFFAQQWHQMPSAFLPAGDYATEEELANIIAHGHSHEWDVVGETVSQKAPSTHDLIDHEHPTVMLFELTFAFVSPDGEAWQSDFPEARALRTPRTLRPPIV